MNKQPVEKGAVMYTRGMIESRYMNPAAAKAVGWICVIAAKQSKHSLWRNAKSLFRKPFNKSVRCLVVGKSYRYTGHREYEDTGDGSFSYFIQDQRLEVWMVVLFPEGSNQYLKPIPVLEDDLSYASAPEIIKRSE